MLAHTSLKVLGRDSTGTGFGTVQARNSVVPVRSRTFFVPEPDLAKHR